MKALFEKWFCRHKWKSHDKREMTAFDPYTNNPKRDYVIEVLICEHCGKITTMKY